MESDAHMLGPQPGALGSLFVWKTAKLSRYNSAVTPAIFPDSPRLFYFPALYSQSHLDFSRLQYSAHFLITVCVTHTFLSNRKRITLLILSSVPVIA